MDDIREWEPATWRRAWTSASGPLAVFVHTPLCGTCKAARRMLAVAGEIVPELPLVAANLNVMPDLAQTFRIESVPCLLFKRADGGVFKKYQFGSVTEVVEQMRRMTGQED